MEKDIFTDDYLLTGKHALMARDLTNVIDQKSGSKIFDSGIELYITAAIIGILNDHKSPKDKGPNDFRIFSAAFNNHRKELLNVYKLVLLCGDSSEIAPEERITKAYRLYKEPENVEYFNSFVRGGIEELNSIFFSGISVRYDDYKNEMIKLLAEFADNDSTVQENDDIFDGDVF